MKIKNLITGKVYTGTNYSKNPNWTNLRCSGNVIMFKNDDPAIQLLRSAPYARSFGPYGNKVKSSFTDPTENSAT